MSCRLYSVRRRRRWNRQRRDWRRYAERATSYAFGIAGDVKLARSAADLEAQREKEALSSQQQ